MSAEFYTILPPPQTLETLDSWGNLDDLPLSLDSVAWETAGIYGLTIADEAVASGSMEGARQSVIPLSASRSKGGEAFAGALRIRSDALTESAKVSATSSESARWLRFRQDVFTATATLSGKLQATLLGNDRIYGYAYSGGGFEGQRTRTALAILTAVAGGAIRGSSIRGLVLTGEATASGQLSAESGIKLKATASASGSMLGVVLGHDWRDKIRPQEAIWGEKITVPEPWQGLQEKTAEWALEGVKEQSWTADKAGTSAWVKYGDEQGGSGIWSVGTGCGSAQWTASPRGEELHPGEAWIQAHEGRCADGVPSAGWQGAGCGQSASWRGASDVGGHGWRAVRA